MAATACTIVVNTPASAPVAIPSNAVPPSNSKVFDSTALQSGVRTVLKDDYGLQGVSGVLCPSDQPVVAGTRFTCAASIDGTAVTIPITITSENGAYEVGRPT